MQVFSIYFQLNEESVHPVNNMDIGWLHGLTINESSFHLVMGNVLKFLQTSLWKMEGVGVSAPPSKSVHYLNGAMFF